MLARAVCQNEQPTTANRYCIQDEYGKILLETDNYSSVLRCYARYLIEERKRVRLIELTQD